MTKLELKKEDWQNIRESAEKLLKQSLIDAEVFRNTLEMAEKQLKTYPEEKKKENNVGTGWTTNKTLISAG